MMWFLCGSDEFVVWMKRALAAESQLTALVRLYDEEQQKLRDAHEAADESDKVVLEMIESARLEKAQWERGEWRLGGN